MAFGIDFGTTHSAITYTATNRVSRLIASSGNRPYPSLVAINRVTGEVLCGESARAHRESLADTDYEVIRSVKRLLGTPTAWKIAGEIWTPTRVAGELFTKLREHAESRGDLTDKHALRQAVVSIPVNFAAAKRQQLREAAESAGITITDFVSEPTAAFIRCSRELTGCRLVAVFDWGGGTLDVSILRINGQQIEELATEGLPQAGDSVDDMLAEWVHHEAFPHGPQFADVPPADRDDLVTACELAKINLNPPSHRKRPQAEALLLRRGVYNGRASSGLRLEASVLDRLIGPLVNDAVAVLDLAMKRARVDDRDLDQLLLVGGSSQLAALRERLEARFGAKVYSPENEAWAASQGASILARQGPGCYRVMQRVCLVQSDGTALDLVKSGEHVGGQPRFFALSLVEDTPAAMLVFAEPAHPHGPETENGSLRTIDCLSVPAGQFPYHHIELWSQLTRDLTLRVVGRASNSTMDGVRAWEYGHLRFTYDMGTGL